MNEKDVYKSCNVHARTRQSCNFKFLNGQSASVDFDLFFG